MDPTPHIIMHVCAIVLIVDFFVLAFVLVLRTAHIPNVWGYTENLLMYSIFISMGRVLKDVFII